MKEFFRKYKHAWILSYGLVYLTWFFYLERTVTSGYHVIHVRLDDLSHLKKFLSFPICCGFSI